jgi:hypothetical protein
VDRWKKTAYSFIRKLSEIIHLNLAGPFLTTHKPLYDMYLILFAVGHPHVEQQWHHTMELQLNPMEQISVLEIAAAATGLTIFWHTLRYNSDLVRKCD